ncbi:TonB-dependent siderophore receptor [Gloeocapsopsis crepidinum LEGE 06123]|uniref:TonB-dependent siderophore receptor n=1 Tax=Gloeocapsopsis crepidinum LEGE 06123 TaxID=588587 RepID=A0ABR9V2C8_9CHRO|nr:TonB-dependent siderophore receptor [Gloeocapsopsis crepidinum]MBE9193658.1 TonB-dependent siderophore receptor [Gloeocapsopsis crepidinum LEGE 06123]
MIRQQQLILAAVVTALVTQPAWAEESPILRRDEMAQPAMTLEEWQDAIAQAVVQITAVQLNPTDAGIEVILEANGQLVTPVTRVIDNALIADIPNAVLTLPNGEFQAIDPTAGVASVSVTNLPGENVQVTITGVDAPPTAQAIAVAQGLLLSIAPQAASEDETIEIVVTGEQDGYLIPETATGTRTNTPTRDIPFSIQIVPQQVLREQQVQRLSEALRNVAGVQSEQSPRSAFDAPRIRGFGGFDSFNIVTNGLQDGNAGAQVGVGNIERVEVLKGPAAALFSQGGPGGTVNIVTKQPLSTPFYNAEASVGSFDTYSGLIDLSGPLDQANNVLYRFNAYGYRTDTFVDLFEIERYGFAPTISLRLDDDTDLTLEAEYNYFEQPNDRGLPARGTVLPNPNGELPISRFLGEPSIDYVSPRTTRLGYSLEHRLNENWQIRNNFRVSLLRQPQNSVFPDTLLEDNRTLTRGLIVAEQQDTNTYVLNADITGNFNTGAISHQLLVGFDLYTLNSASRYVQRSLSPIDIFNPVYSPSTVGDVIAEFSPSSTNTDQYGIYIQDQITLLDNLKLLLGGRFDWVEQRTKEEGELTGSQSDDAFSPRVGIVYQPIQPISLYASYSRSFQQVTDSGLDNRLFEPERGTQYEVGTKVELSDRIAATIAYFNITRANVLTEDPTNPNFSIQTGEQQSQGIELDVTGEILPGWNIIAGYAYTNAEITEDNTYDVGNQINNVPNHAFNIWTTYEIQSGSLQGLGFGLGLFYVGEREGDLDNSFSLPSYFRTDAALFYNRGQFRVALNVRNLFDIRYFETAEGDLRVFPGEPLTLLGSVSWQF